MMKLIIIQLLIRILGIKQLRNILLMITKLQFTVGEGYKSNNRTVQTDQTVTRSKLDPKWLLTSIVAAQ